MRVKSSWALLGAVALTSSWAGAAELRLRVGETRLLSVGKSQGAALDNPTIADIRILKDSRVEIAAKANGEGKLSIYAADGKMQIYAVRVTGGPDAKNSSGPGQAAATNAWPKAVFGGARIPDARCAEPLDDEDAAAAMDDARDLLRQERIESAIEKLDRALTIEPDAAVVHLFLGSAWAKLKDQGRGAASYETFVLSCPEDPKAKAVVRLLREFDHRVTRSKPES
jgi:hypothetical protein